MAAEIVTTAELLAYGRASGTLEEISDADTSPLDGAVAKAVDRVRQAALNDYTAASFEALTAATAPPEMRDHTLAIALDAQTKADGQRPDSIGIALSEAAQWLRFLAGGTTHYDLSPGAVLVKRGTNSEVTYKSPARKFDDPWSVVP